MAAMNPAMSAASPGAATDRIGQASGAASAVRSMSLLPNIVRLLAPADRYSAPLPGTVSR